MNKKVIEYKPVERDDDDGDGCLGCFVLLVLVLVGLPLLIAASRWAWRLALQ